MTRTLIHLAWAAPALSLFGFSVCAQVQPAWVARYIPSQKTPLIGVRFSQP